MKIRIGLLALPLVVFAAAGGLAHEGKTHIMGTITTVDAERLVIKNGEGKIVSIRLTKDTTVHKGDVLTAVGNLKVGDRVVVDVVGQDSDLAATEIRTGTGPAEPAHTAGHEQHK